MPPVVMANRLAPSPRKSCAFSINSRTGTYVRVLGEDVAGMSMIDRLNRLEQLRWLDSAESWMEHRRIRNEFTHDYPEAESERFERIKLALSSAEGLVVLLDRMSSRAALMGTSRKN